MPPAPEPVKREDLVKGYEYARDRYVVLSKEDLARITAENSREMQILEFVRLAEIDPVYFETSYYVSPDRAGERAYALLLEALRRTGFTAVARLAMHNREHVVVIRPGRTGMILHTLFFEDEIRRDDEYRTDTSGVNPKELDLAVRLIESLASPFEPSKYKDTYREKLQELIQAKMAGEETHEAPAPKPAPVIDILQALQRSLEMAERKPAASEKGASSSGPVRRGARKRSGGQS
jgi:DNA end-binding protein Ku